MTAMSTRGRLVHTRQTGHPRRPGAKRQSVHVPSSIFKVPRLPGTLCALSIIFVFRMVCTKRLATRCGTNNCCENLAHHNRCVTPGAVLDVDSLLDVPEVLVIEVCVVLKEGHNIIVLAWRDNVENSASRILELLAKVSMAERPVVKVHRVIFSSGHSQIGSK